MFLPPFEGPAAKLERARHHYADMLITLADYQRTAKPHFVRAEQPPHYWTVAISDQVPPVVALQIGDIAHSLRSSLDVMLCDIALLKGIGLSDMAYPFAKNEADFKDKLSQPNRQQPFKKLGTDIVSIIDESKPYKGGDWALRGLHDLNNQDKHRMAVPYVSFVSCTSKFTDSLAEWGLPRMINLGGLLVGLNVGEAILLNEESIKHPSEKYEFNPIPMIVCFAPNFVLGGNVITTMAKLIDYIDDLLEKLTAAARK